MQAQEKRAQLEKRRAKRRLLNDFRCLCELPSSFGSASPRPGDIFTWDLCVLGPPDDVIWAGAVVRVCAQFSIEYPFSPPVLSFTERCFHPNISEYDGRIALYEATGSAWSPANTVESLLEVVQKMPAQPNLKYQLNSEAAFLFNEQRNVYAERVREMCDRPLPFISDASERGRNNGEVRICSYSS